MVLEILMREKAMISHGIIHNGIADLTLIKSLDSIRTNLFISPGQIPVDKDLTWLGRLSINQVGF